MKSSIVLTGGGTAGHVWPHFALFDDPKSPLSQAFQSGALQVHYFGSKEGLERDLVTSTMPSWQYHSIETGKLRRYFSLKNLFDPVRVLVGLWQAFWILRKIKPFVVFSKGGFVAAPVVWAAWLNRIPVVIHESDATPALATKLTAPFACKVLFAFPNSISHLPKIFQKKAYEVGLPLRASLFGIANEDARKHFSFHNAKKVILVFGGSLGAKQLNLNIAEVLPNLCEQYNVIHITGKGNRISFTHPDYRQFEFLKEDMKFAYGAADLAICRAGASSLFELACAQIPMILIPLGLNASRGDQIINARIFVQKGWAESYEEEQFKRDMIVTVINNNIHKLKEKKAVLAAASIVDSANQVAHILFEFSGRADNLIKILKPGDWVFLSGDLGAGKTFFVQKMCQKMGVTDVVSSPTYSIMNIYSVNYQNIQKILHLDLYRLKTPLEICVLGLEQEFDPTNTVAFYEWPSILSEQDWEQFFQVTHCHKPSRIHNIDVSQFTADS